MEQQSIKVLIVDDHEMVRLGLMSYLETEPRITVIGAVANGLEAVKFCQTQQPDVILMDLIMEPIDGVETTRRIKAQYPQIKIIVLTSYFDESLVMPVLEAGAISYLLKTAKAQQIVDAIFNAIENKSFIEPSVAAKVLNLMRKEPQPHELLTNRELEVLRLLGQGKTNQEIAEILNIGIKTVKTHVSNVLAKLGVEDRTQAAIYANRNRLV